nr:MAG TPA_asm: hypothetical protein [Caudoviricetes sp.]
MVSAGRGGLLTVRGLNASAGTVNHRSGDSATPEAKRRLNRSL